MEGLKLNFEILYDSANQFAEQLDMVHGFPDELMNLYKNTFSIDVGASNGQPVWRLPIPSRFVIDQQHQTKAAEVNASYTVRPEPEETLKIVSS